MQVLHLQKGKKNKQNKNHSSRSRIVALRHSKTNTSRCEAIYHPASSITHVRRDQLRLVGVGLPEMFYH